VQLAIDDLTFEGGFASFLLGRIIQDFVLLPVIDTVTAIDNRDAVGVILATGGAILKPLRGVRAAGELNDLARRSRKTTVIGNGQTTRVVPFAERTGGRTLDNGLTEAQWNALTPRQRLKLNDGELRRHINAGDQFRDIGPDGLERSLDLRRAELLRLRDRGIPVERVSPGEVRRVLGQ
jgi:hypothetical protein